MSAARYSASSSRLFDFSRIMGVPIAYFYGERPGDVAKQSPGTLRGQALSRTEFGKDPEGGKR